MQRRAVTGPRNVTTAWDDSHLVRMAMTDRTASSTVWRVEWRNVVFSYESRFNMSYNDGRIRVRRYASELNLRASILQRHRGPTPSCNGLGRHWIQYAISPPTY